jgi:ribose/xylose/arabinose/galactoside ABC-type transport system permease subunit
LGISAYWERAVQGGIILAALVIDAVRTHARQPRQEEDGSNLAASSA